MYWTVNEPIEQGWEVDSGYTSRERAEAKAAGIIPAYEWKIKWMSTTDGGRWIILARLRKEKHA